MIRNAISLLLLTSVLLPASFASGLDRPYIFGMNPIWAAWTKKPPETWEPAMFDRVKEAGAACVRIGIGWDWIEREPNVYDFRHNDRAIEMALERGLEVVGLWVGCATYATSSPEPYDPERNDLGRWMPKEENAADFERVTRVLAAHYRGRIKMWEFWNEANHLGMNPQPAQTAHYAPWLRRAYRSIKAVDPDALVGTTGMDGPDTRFLTELYQLGYGDSFDAVVVHPYSSIGINGPGLIDIRKVMLAHGDAHKPVWITEFGWGINPADVRSLELQAENVRRSYDILLRDDFSFVTVATFHTICDFDPTGSQYYGLCDIDLNPRPAFAAYQECVARKAPRESALLPALPVQPTLQNAGFERGDLTGWTEYGRADGVMRSGDHGVEAPEGQAYWGAAAAWDVKYGGIMQRVAAHPGKPLRATVALYTNVRGGAQENVRMRVGIDPAGGSDPLGFDIAWTEWTSTGGAWRDISTPSVQPAEDSVTIFIEQRHSWGLEWNHGCADNVRLSGE